MYDKIVLMCPTYKRSKTLLPKFISSAINTADLKDSLQFCFCVNGTDADTIEFLNGYDFCGYDYEIILENTRQPNLAKYFNMMYERSMFSSCKETVVTMLGDDMEFITNGWDKKILDSVNDNNGIGVFYCDDDYIAHESLCVNLFVTKKFVECCCSKFMDERFAADMIDVVWYNAGFFSNTLRYLGDVKIRHNHNTRLDRSKFDETFNRLIPIQGINSTEQNHIVAKAIGARMASDIIKCGYGESIFEVLN